MPGPKGKLPPTLTKEEKEEKKLKIKLARQRAARAKQRNA